MTQKKLVKKAAPKPKGTPSQATAASILGMVNPKAKNGGNKDVKIKPEWMKFYRILVDLREQLVRQRNGLVEESAQEMSSYSLHMADSGTDAYDRDFALSLLSSDQDAIYEIDEALRRIERNTYGICELTGKPIPKARLEAIPWTRFTVEAQSQLEREGILRQRRLGILGTIDSTGITETEVEEEEGEEKPAKEKE